MNPITKIGLDYSIRWSEQHKKAYLSQLKYFLNGDYILSINSPPEKGRAEISQINFGHHLFQEKNKESESNNLIDYFNRISNLEMNNDLNQSKKKENIRINYYSNFEL